MPKTPLFTKDDYFKFLRNIISPSGLPPIEMDGGGGGPPEEELPTQPPPVDESLIRAVRISQGARDQRFQPVRQPGQIPTQYMEPAPAPVPSFQETIREMGKTVWEAFLQTTTGPKEIREERLALARKKHRTLEESARLAYLMQSVAGRPEDIALAMWPTGLAVGAVRKVGVGVAKGVGKPGAKAAGVGKGAGKGVKGAEVAGGKAVTEAKVAPTPAGYRLQEIAGKWDIYRPDGELIGTRPTREAASEYAQAHQAYHAKVAPSPAAPEEAIPKPPARMSTREREQMARIQKKETLAKHGLVVKGGQLVADPANPLAARAFVAELRKLATETEAKAIATTESKARLLRQNARAAFKDADRIEKTIPAEAKVVPPSAAPGAGAVAQGVAMPSKKTLEQDAIKDFGLTTNSRETGYILEDGKMLDFSGKNIGGEVGVRSLDHRDIGRIYPENYKLPENENWLTVFEKDVNAIRYSEYAKSGVNFSLNIGRQPTQAQIARLKAITIGKTVNFDLYAPNGQVIFSKEFASMTPREIDALIKRAVAPPPTAPIAEAIAPGVAKAPAEAIKLPVEAPGAILKVGEVPPTKPPIEPPIKGEVAPRPPEGSATKRVLDTIQMEPMTEGFIEKVRQGYHQFQVSMIDDLYALKKFTGQATKGGVELAIEENPYILARLLRGVSGKINTFIEQGTFGKKFWKIEKGKAVPNFTGESLENILKEVRKPEAWQDFSAYLKARRTVKLIGRNIKTGLTLEDATAAIKELETKYKGFSQLADRYYKNQDRVLVYGQETGMISEELLAKLRLPEYGDYTPFDRVFNELQVRGLFGKKMANIASPIKRISGSELDTINPLESSVKNTHVLINAADRNQVGIMMANLVDKNPELATLFERVKTPTARVAGVTAKELGLEIEGLSDDVVEAVVDIFRPSFFTKGDEVTVLINGKKAYFKVDPDLRDALLNLDRESLGMIGKFLSLPAKWLRAGATLSPDFMVRNPARDQLTAMVYSNYNFLPGVDFVKGLAGLFRKEADYTLFRLSGAEHSMMVSMDREYLHKTFREIVQGKKFTDYVKKPLELFQIISELGEKATRLGEFNAGIRSGAIPLGVGYAARNVTLDFAQAGTTARSANTLIAFFNANVRGWAKMVSAFKEHPVRTSAKVFAGITLPSILLYAANRDDPRWKEIPQWQKDLFWIVMTKDTIYRIPKPFELGLIFGSVPERFMEWLDNKDPNLFRETLKNLVEAGSPGFLPTAALPIIENLSNYSFFRGGPIVPASREKMPPELQYTRWTSEVSKHLGELLKQPPAKIDNLINGWTGGLGRYATDILDGILKNTGISPDIPEPSPTLADRPVIKAFVVRNPYGSSGQAVESFYSELEKYEQGEKYLKEMMALGDKEKFEQYKAAHPELLFFMDFEKDTFYSASARYLRRVARDLTELRKKQDGIYKATDISPAEKRRLIDEIDVLKTEITRKALGLLTGEGQVLQESIKDAIKKLGTIIEETPILSLEKPDIFDTKKLYTEFGNLLEAATKEDLSKLKDIDPMASAFVGARDIKKETGSILNKQVSDIKLDLKEGVSFEEYYKAWQSGAEKNEEFDKLTRRQLDLLVAYNKLDKPGKAQFLKDHPELKANPYQEWLKSHPKENAQLAIWGQAKLLTQEADTEARRLIKELDIPDSALPDLTLPPELSVKGYVQYLEQGKEFGYNSAEVKLLLARDDKLREFLEREPIETPVASLELKVKHRKLFDLWDAYSDLGSPEYMNDRIKNAQGLTARDLAQAKLKADNPQWVDDMRRIEAIENEADDKTVEAWVEHGKLAGEAPGFNAEEKLWLIDHPEVHQWALKQKLLTDDGSKWNEPVLRLDVKWRKEDAEYDALPTTGDDRANYLAGNKEYRLDRRRREGWKLNLDITKGTTSEAFAKFIIGYDVPAIAFESLNMEFGDVEFRKRYGAGYAAGKITISSLQEDISVIAHEVAHWAHEQLLSEEEKISFTEQLLPFDSLESSSGLSANDKKVWEYIKRVRKDWGFPVGTSVKQMSWEVYAELYAESGGNIDKIPTPFQHYFDSLTNPKARRLTKTELQQGVLNKLRTISPGEFKDRQEEMIEYYVSFKELPIKGKRQDRFLVENPDFAKALYDAGQITDLPNPAKVPAVQFDDIYDQFPDQFDEIEGNGKPESKWFEPDPIKRAARDKALRFDPTGKYTKFGLAEIERKAYSLFVPEKHIKNYVAYYELSERGFRRERMLVGDPEFAKTMHEVVGFDLPDPDKVPAVQYDEITDKYQKQFDTLEGMGNNESEFYIEDPNKREIAREAMRFDVNGKFTEFGLAELRRKAYGLLVPERHIQNHVDYYRLVGEGKPINWEQQTGTDRWYEDDWWMMEHPDFYKEVWLGILENERKDYRKVPTREVFNLYLQYLRLPKGVARKDFRQRHPELEQWGKRASLWGVSTTTSKSTTTAPSSRSVFDILEEQGLMGAFSERFK